MADCSSSTAYRFQTLLVGITSPNAITGHWLKNPYHRNNFGGTFGGPISTTSLLLFSYAGLRQVQELRSQAVWWPTAAEAWATLPDTFKVYNPKPSGTTAAVWARPANQVKRNKQ